MKASRWIPLTVVTGLASLAAAIGLWFSAEPPTLLLLVCLLLPAFGVTAAQDGVARAYGWVNLALLPPFVIRPVLMLALMLAAVVWGFAPTATTALTATAVATWLAAIGQFIPLARRIGKRLPPARAAYALPAWLSTALPILLVNGFFLLLTHVDVLLLQQFRPSEEVAIYFAAAKGTALIAMVYFSVSAAATRKFAAYDAAGDGPGLRGFYRSAIGWMFWPSLGASAVLLMIGKPFLWLFGPEFTAGYPLLFIMVIGVMARASVGPAEQLLNMLGQLRACIAVYAIAFTTSLVLCLILIPRLGVIGAAASTATALVVESALFFTVAKLRLGVHAFVWAPRKRQTA